MVKVAGDTQVWLHVISHTPNCLYAHILIVRATHSYHHYSCDATCGPRSSSPPPSLPPSTSLSPSLPPSLPPSRPQSLCQFTTKVLQDMDIVVNDLDSQVCANLISVQSSSHRPLQHKANSYDLPYHALSMADIYSTASCN